MARTRAVLEAQITDDLARSDLTTQVTDAVDFILRYYSDDRFYFNECTRCSVTLSSSIAYLSLAVPPMPAKLMKIDRINVEVASIGYEVMPANVDDILFYQDVTVFSRPCLYAVYDDKLQFDVAADQNYTLNFWGIQHLGNLTSQTFSAQDTSAWFNDAAELIRSGAKRNLYGHVIKDDRMAAMCVEAENDAYSMLKGMTTRKKSTGFIRPNYF